MGFKIFSLAFLGLIVVVNCQSDSQKLVSNAVSILEVKYLSVLSASAQYTSDAIRRSYNLVNTLSRQILDIGDLIIALQEAADILEIDTTNCTVQENAIATGIDSSLILSCITANVFDDDISALNKIVSDSATTIKQCITEEDQEKCVSDKLDNYVSQMDSLSNEILENIKTVTENTNNCIDLANSNNLENIKKATDALQGCL